MRKRALLAEGFELGYFELGVVLCCHLCGRHSRVQCEVDKRKILTCCDRRMGCVDEQMALLMMEMKRLAWNLRSRKFAGESLDDVDLQRAFIMRSSPIPKQDLV